MKKLLITLVIAMPILTAAGSASALTLKFPSCGKWTCSTNCGC